MTAAFPVPFVARCARLWQGTRNRRPPLSPTGHPRVNHWTVHLATEESTLSPGPPSLLVPQYSQNMHPNTTFASRDELIPGSPVPASELPAPATTTTPLAAGYASGEPAYGGGTVREPVPEPKGHWGWHLLSPTPGFKARLAARGMLCGCQQMHHLPCHHYSALDS